MPFSKIFQGGVRSFQPTDQQTRTNYVYIYILCIKLYKICKLYRSMHINHRCIETYRASFKDFSVEGPTTKRDFREERKSGEVYRLGVWSGGPPLENFCIFEFSSLISCNFSMIFAHFQIKRDFY